MGDHPGIFFTLPRTAVAGLSHGLPGKSHRCLKYAVEALLVDEGMLDSVVLRQFSFAMDLREGADYGCIYDTESARTVVTSAREVLGMVRP